MDGHGATSEWEWHVVCFFMFCPSVVIIIGKLNFFSLQQHIWKVSSAVCTSGQGFPSLNKINEMFTV